VQYYDFHPMYSTSQPKTIPTWTASTYNVAFDAETGHFDFCTHIDANTGNCNGLEGIPGDREPADGDDQACFGSEESLLYPVTGCANTNDPGFDGVPYHRLWPNGSSTHPTSFLFSSPTTTGGVHYSQVGFNADLPRIEAADLGGVCDRVTGLGCTNPPKSDDGNPVPFYPYYSTVAGPDGCDWGVGGHLPNTLNNFGGSSKAEYGPLVPNYRYVFNGGGATMRQYNVYQRVIANPC
jgi:hypothetical protein